MKPESKGTWNFALNKLKPIELTTPFGFCRDSSSEVQSKSAKDKKASL